VQWEIVGSLQSDQGSSQLDVIVAQVTYFPKEAASERKFLGRFKYNDLVIEQIRAEELAEEPLQDVDPLEPPEAAQRDAGPGMLEVTRESGCITYSTRLMLDLSCCRNDFRREFLMLLSFRIPTHLGIVQKSEWCLGPAAYDKLKQLLAPFA
jgi:hypothetical protein